MTEPYELWTGDCRELVGRIAPGTVDSIVCDPPYEYGFMGKSWDRSGVAFQPETWAAMLPVVRPGSHLIAFGGPRTAHRLAVAIEDAGWELRDAFLWLYGSGMPKSLNVGREIDRRGGVSVAWFGPWLRTERERRGITQKALAVHFPSESGGLTGCVSNWELGYNLPTPDQFNTLCHVLGLPFDRMEEAERQVIETRTDVGGRRVGIVGANKPQEYDVTAAASDLAKQWDGWGTGMKPAYEIAYLARAPFTGTVAENVMAHGTSAINILGCKIEYRSDVDREQATPQGRCTSKESAAIGAEPDAGRNLDRVDFARPELTGRWPANVILTHSPDCAASQGGPDRAGGGVTHCTPDCPVAMLDAQAPATGAAAPVTGAEPSESTTGIYNARERVPGAFYGDTGGASRFLYTSKAPRSERDAGLPADMVNDHPTVKPIDVMRWLARLVTPPGGLVFDPFSGSGSTGCAAELEGFRFLGIDLYDTHTAIAQHRMRYWRRMAATARAAQWEIDRAKPLDLFDCL